MVAPGKKGLEEKITHLPDTCGIYIFKDSPGNFLYIGKAKSLKKRVQSYFNRYLDSKTQALVSKIKDVEYILSPSEAQAQILEAALIKAKQPTYNISLKDDKSFPLIRISAEKFPLLSICRRKGKDKEDKTLYFGPYANVYALRQAVKSIRHIFGFRSCKTLPKKICLYHRLKLCPAPCIGKISLQRYTNIIKKIRLFLECRNEELLKYLGQEMNKAAEGKKFEEAAKIRDQINALSTLMQSKKDGAGRDALEGLKDLFGLNNLPQRIEAFDISNISGLQAAGSMVSFFKGIPDKNNYRRFRIKTVEGIDDYAMLKEVIKRRYLRLKEERLALPDLIIIDGGKGHLLAARQVVRKLGLKIPLASIAKDRENIYLEGRGNPIKLEADTSALNLIRKIRDEAHRFAIKYHHLLRKKKILGK